MAAILMMSGPDTAQAQSSTNSPGNCAAPAEWFTGTVPDPGIHAAEGTKFASLCDFHTWSWNAFLWLMEEKDGALRFESFPTIDQVLDGTYDPMAKPAATVALNLRTAKSDHPINSIAQAATPGILVDQAGRAVYYSQYVNPQMYDQIRGANWFNAVGIMNSSPYDTFSVGNIELKASWQVVPDAASAGYAYTRPASIPRVAKMKVDGVETFGVPSDPADRVHDTVTVALVGFHVVGWVAGHSEAIWASFSPPGIAPVVPDNPVAGPVSPTGTPFYKAGATLADCNQTAVPIQSLEEDSQTFSVRTNACQIYAQGTLPTDGDGSKVNANRVIIEQLNDSVASQLSAGSVAGLYHEIGAVWSISDFTAWCNTQPSDPPIEACKPSLNRPTEIPKDSPEIAGKLNTTFQDQLKGSNVLSNPGIETFTQTTISQENCFGCHNSMQYQPTVAKIPALQASMLNLSHIIISAYVNTYSSGN
jgi:hypothetical protein